MLVGGALMNAFAFSGSNYLFFMLRISGLDEDRKRHKTIEKLQATQAEWSRKRTERLDWINEDLRRQRHAVQTFRDVKAAIHEYSRVTGQTLDPLGPDFYLPSSGHRDREIAFAVLEWLQPVWWPTNSLSDLNSPAFLAVGNRFAMLANKLYLAMLEIGHAARRHKFPGPVAHTMIDTAQKTLER